MLAAGLAIPFAACGRVYSTRMKNVALLVLANLIWAAQPTAVKYIAGDVLGPFAIAFLPFFVITAVLASLLLGERVTRLRVVCLAIGLAGVLLMSAKDLGNLSRLGHGYLLGNLLFLGGCLGASFYHVYCKGLMGRFPDRDILIYSYVAATIGSLPFLLWREPGSFQSLFQLDAAGWLDAITAIGAAVDPAATILVMRYDTGT